MIREEDACEIFRGQQGRETLCPFLLWTVSAKILMILSAIKIRSNQSNRDELLQVVSSFLEPSRCANGCEGFWLYEDLYDKSSLILFSQWQSQESLDQYIRSGHFSQLLSLLELSDESPEMQFYQVSNIKGIEVVESARLQR